MSKAILGSGAGQVLRAFSDLLGQAEQVAFSTPIKRSGPMGRAHEQAKTTGYDEGFAQGQAEGLANGHAAALQASAQQRQADLQAFAGALNALRDDAVGAIDQWYVEAEEPMAALATVIAARVINHELQSEPGIILAMVREAIGEVTHASSARIRVNIRDHASLCQHSDQISAIAPSLKDVDVVADDTIAGGCVIDTDGGMIEATIDSKLRAALEAMRG